MQLIADIEDLSYPSCESLRLIRLDWWFVSKQALFSGQEIGLKWQVYTFAVNRPCSLRVVTGCAW